MQSETLAASRVAVPCPDCGSESVHVSHPRTPGEHVVRVLGAVPWRCHNCDLRYFFAGNWVVNMRALHQLEAVFGALLTFVTLGLMYYLTHHH